jgi:hypothetical protein
VNSTIATAHKRAHVTPADHRERLFYLIACVLMIASVAIGFRMFYMHGLNDASQPVTHQTAPIHGGLMTC